MSTKPQELNKVIADLRQIIVGKVAMPTDQIEQITLFLFLKQLSRKHDDLVRIGSKELIFTGAWERYHFDVLMRHSGEELVKECREAVESLYKNPHIDTTVRKVFERSYLKILEPKVLSSFLQYLNDKFSDGLDLGDFYESLLPILGTQNELGQFRTPRHIIDFIVRVVDPNIGEKIADPACGTAGFLVAAFNYLKEKYTDEKGRLKLNPEQTKKLYNETIFGWDMEPLMVKFSLANLYLHGLKVPNVSENDTLLNENLWQHTFDIILANPPFITPKGGAKRHSRFAITSNKTEVLFCEYMVHHLNFNGRMGVIVPEGIIFDASKGHQAIRKLFLDNGLWCVVSLPAQVFQPYSGVKTSIIFLDKTLEPENILFYKIENHGFSLNTNPTPIDKNDLPNALKILKNYRADLQNGKQNIIEEIKYYTTPKQKILENLTSDLSSNKYEINKKAQNKEWPFVELGEVAEVFNGITNKKSDYKISGSIKVIKVKDYDENRVYFEKNESGWLEKNIETDKFLKIGDSLIINAAHAASSVGKKIGYCDNLPAFKCLPSGEVMIVRATEKINPILLNKIIKSEIVRKEIQLQIKGIHLYPKDVKKIKIPLPPLEIQEQIVSELEIYQRVIDGARSVYRNWKPSFEVDLKWEVVKLKDIFETITPPQKIQTSKYKQAGKYPIIDQSQDDIAGWSDDESALVKSNKPIVIFGDHTCATKYSEVPFVQGADGIKILETKDNCLPKFLFYMLRMLPIGTEGYKRHFGKLKLTKISLPPIEIQKQIVAKIEEEQKIIEANKKLIDLFQQKIEAKIKSIYG